MKILKLIALTAILLVVGFLGFVKYEVVKAGRALENKCYVIDNEQLKLYFNLGEYRHKWYKLEGEYPAFGLYYYTTFDGAMPQIAAQDLSEQAEIVDCL